MQQFSGCRSKDLYIPLKDLRIDNEFGILLSVFIHVFQSVDFKWSGFKVSLEELLMKVANKFNTLYFCLLLWSSHETTVQVTFKINSTIGVLITRQAGVQEKGLFLALVSQLQKQ